MDVVRSVAFAVIFYTGTVGYVAGALATARLAPRTMARIVRGWGWYHRVCVQHILQIDIRETGRRPTGPVLYAIRHETFFEAIDLPMLLDRPAPFAKQELLELPGWGRAAATYGVIPVARDQGARALRAMVRAGQAMTAEGRPLAIFPEGTRVPHGVRVPLRAGFAALYKLLALPVVPVAVDSGRLYTGFVKRRGTITILFGEAIAPGLPRAEIEARVEQAINALNTPGLPSEDEAGSPLS